ncbi:MAG: monovalent cation/H+ antiporter complex subunit F [Mogibacterium sp.]|nr:monovalent cation/H+ antiporter complex subunit F [Mogibacterium sp.]
MKTVLMALLIGLVAIVLTMLVFTCSRKDIYDKLNAIFAMNTNIVLLIMVVGFIDGRYDMYIDIALSYAILGFVTTVILAKYIGGHRR